MFPFTPNSVVFSKLVGQATWSKVRTDDQQDASICHPTANKCSSGYGIIVRLSNRHEDGGASVTACSRRKQNSVQDDVFISHSHRDVDGYVSSPHDVSESECKRDLINTAPGKQRTVHRATSDRYYSDAHWAVQSHAVPSRSSGTFSFSESVRLCQSCGTRFTNSISLYGSHESLSFGEHQTGTDVFSTICSVFWKMSLTFHPFVSSADNRASDLVEFSSLWPNSRGLACLLPEICASLPGSIEMLCRIAVFADVVKLLNALIECRIVGKLI